MAVAACPQTPLQPPLTLRQQDLQARFVQKEFASLLQLGARKQSREVGKIVDIWGDGAVGRGKVGGGCGRVFKFTVVA